MFVELANLLRDGQSITLHLKPKADKLSLCAFVEEKGKERSTEVIKPLILTGSPEELEREFLEKIITPLQQVTGVISNLPDVQQSLKKVAAAATAGKGKNADKPLDTGEQIKTLMENVLRLEREQNYPEAIKKLEEVLKLKPTHMLASSKLKELKMKSRQTNFFPDQTAETATPHTAQAEERKPSEPVQQNPLLVPESFGAPAAEKAPVSEPDGIRREAGTNQPPEKDMFENLFSNTTIHF